MKVQAVSVSRIDGSKTGNKYDLCRLEILVPTESREGISKAGDPYRVRSTGFTTNELDLSIEAYEVFKFFKFPLPLDVIVDNEMRFGRLLPLVSGVNEAKAA